MSNEPPKHDSPNKTWPPAPLHSQVPIAQRIAGSQLTWLQVGIAGLCLVGLEVGTFFILAALFLPEKATSLPWYFSLLAVFPVAALIFSRTRKPSPERTTASVVSCVMLFLVLGCLYIFDGLLGFAQE